MKVQNTVVIELTHKEAARLAKVLPDYLHADTEDQEFASKIREEICDKLSIKPWDL